MSTWPIATTTLQPIRTISGGGGVFADDPAVATADLAALPGWSTSGRSRYVAVFIAAVDAAGTRVPGVTATVGGYFYNPPAAFGLAADKPEVWHDADTRTGVVLDRPLVFDMSHHPKMGVRLSSIVDGTSTATQIRISVQEMPRT